MKKFISLLIIAALVLSIPMTALAADSDTPAAVDNSGIQAELNKITDKAKREKIEQFLFTTVYTETYVGDQASQRDDDSILETIQHLNEYSGEYLEQQMASLVKDTINQKIGDPNVTFTDDAVLLVQKYYPEKLDKVKAKAVPEEILPESDTTSQTLSTEAGYYASFGAKGYGVGSGTYIWDMRIYIDWAGSGGSISYCYIDNKTFWLSPTSSLLDMGWAADSVKINGGTADIKQDYRLWSGGAASYTAWIKVTVRSNGTFPTHTAGITSAPHTVVIY